MLDDAAARELAAAAPRADVRRDPDALAAHAHDWWPRLIMRRRAGAALVEPDAVVAPADSDEVAAVLRWCHDNEVAVVPYGAGTGVCGGAAPVAGAITLDLKRLASIGPIDPVSGTVEVGPGVIAQTLEDHLRHRGWTLGHFPSSIHCSTVGGLLAVRSAGQASSRYGKMEDMVVALEVVLADGSVYRSRAVPQSAAGPDLDRLFLGGEGTTGVITRATLRLWPAPETVLDRGWLVEDLQTGLDALRDVMHAGVRPAVLRLYDEADTAMVFGEAGDEPPDGCLLITGCEGPDKVARTTAEVVGDVLVAAGATDLGPGPGERWRAHRHDVSYRFADYMRPGGEFGDAVTLDTFEIAGLWSRLPALYRAVGSALERHVDVVLAHVSHVYPEGGSIYFTFGAANAGDEQAAVRRYDAAWKAAVEACLQAGGTMSHHHGVGLVRAPWLPDELGPGGMDVLRRVKGALDPGGRLNPGKLGLGEATA